LDSRRWGRGFAASRRPYEQDSSSESYSVVSRDHQVERELRGSVDANREEQGRWDGSTKWRRRRSRRAESHIDGDDRNAGSFIGKQRRPTLPRRNACGGAGGDSDWLFHVCRGPSGFRSRSSYSRENLAIDQRSLRPHSYRILTSRVFADNDIIPRPASRQSHSDLRGAELLLLFVVSVKTPHYAIREETISSSHRRCVLIERNTARGGCLSLASFTPLMFRTTNGGWRLPI
jgi:hypothetical protein